MSQGGVDFLAERRDPHVGRRGGRKVKVFNTEGTEDHGVKPGFSFHLGHRLTSGLVGNRVDKILVPAGISTLGDDEGLAMRFGCKRG
jgi:hypothetical protein